jgi:hypothetical protein
LTNACLAYAEKVFSVYHLRTCFACVHGADSVPKPKPHPDGLWLCVSEMGLPREACCHLVYVGDSPSDGKAARAAGMVAVGVSWGSYPRDALLTDFDFVVDSVSELRDLLLNRGVPAKVGPPLNLPVATPVGPPLTGPPMKAPCGLPAVPPLSGSGPPVVATAGPGVSASLLPRSKKWTVTEKPVVPLWKARILFLFDLFISLSLGLVVVVVTAVGTGLVIIFLYWLTLF